MPHKNYSDNYGTYAVPKLPTFRDDFSSYVDQTAFDTAWVSSDITPTGFVRGNPTTNVIDFEAVADTTNDSIAFDLQTILGSGINASDIKWVLRFKIRYSTLTGNDPFGGSIHSIGLSDSDQSVASNVSQDFIGMQLFASTNRPVYVVDTDGAVLPTASGDNTFNSNITTGIDYYVEIKRLSSTLYSIEWFNDSTFTTSIGNARGICSPNTKNLRYIVWRNVASAMSGAGTAIGTIDNVEFWNGVDKGTVTFQDDFSGADNWVDAGTGVGVNTTTDVIDWDTSDSNANNVTVYDLTTVNNSNWLLRFKLTINNLVQGTDLTASIFYLGISSISQASGSSTAQDFIGFRLLNNLNNLEWNIFDTNNQGLGAVGADATFTTVPAVGTIWVVIRRTSLDSYDVSFYSDSNYRNLIERRTGVTTNGTQTLRYIKFTSDNTGDGTENGTQNGTIDDVEFYNGVSVANNTLNTIPELDFNFSSSTGWVQTGTGVIVDTVDQRIEGWSTEGNVDRRVTYDMGSNGILSEPDWTAEFEYEWSASNLPAHAPLMFTDLNQDIDGGGSTDAIGVVHGLGVNELRASYLDSADAGTGLVSSSGIPVSINIRYYVRLERIRNTTLKISVFSDPDFTRHITSSPQFLTVPSTVTGLRYAHSQNISGGSALRSLTGILDSLKVYRTQRGTEKENKWLVVG